MRGQDARYQLTLDFLDAVNGTTRRVTLPDGRTLDVRIPAGVGDGQVIRLKGQGMPGIGDGAAGDALVEVSVAPHPVFRREGEFWSSREGQIDDQLFRDLFRLPHQR
jgi:DnaJ-class molecular chaperone